MSSPAAVSTEKLGTVTFLTGTRANDAVANYWLGQVTLRLRREVCWLWRERGALAGIDDSSALLPPFTDRAMSTLDFSRYEREKQEFMGTDVTARYLTQLIVASPSREQGPEVAPRGSFSWVVDALDLPSVDRFVLALALLPLVDSASGSVIATCSNDPARVEPTLALAQRLWDVPTDVMRLFDHAHPLIRHGLLPVPPTWDSPLTIPGLVARELLFAEMSLPSSMRLLTSDVADGRGADGLVGRIAMPIATARASAASGRHVVPIVGPRGAALDEIAAACMRTSGRDVVGLVPGTRAEELPQVLTTAWLRGAAVYIGFEQHAMTRAHDETFQLPLPSLPITVFIGMHDRASLKHLTGSDVTPAIHVPPLTYAERLECWRRSIPPERSTSALDADLAEISRRFRYERGAIARIATEISLLEQMPARKDLIAVCREDVDIGSLAQEVSPRFHLDELMLPPAQSRQIAEIVLAMRNLTRVHHEWGTARAWNEGGLTALFAGPSGTGKTMAAEALASELDVPMYRVDLSQVVNKYIGETEKNLRQLFDAADNADIMLFFDEADALFGKRTEVTSAHDRYANLEVSYLLERMERFKGLAILATNRKKDFDEALMRRLRFSIDFPMPGQAERLRIWKSVMPAGIDVSALDFPFLAQRFTLAGGHIRSIVFHASLQSASADGARALTMPAIVRAIRREYDKLDRAMSLDQFGPYADLVAEEATR